MGVEAGGLQSGLVIGVVITVLLLTDRLGGPAPLTLRAAQLVFALALVMLVLGATATYSASFNAPADPFDPPDQEFAAATAEFARRSSVTGTVHAALAIAFVALGVALSRSWGALATGVVLAGALLILVGLPDAWHGGYAGSAAYGSVFIYVTGTAGDAGDMHNVVRLAVLAAGALIVAGAIHLRWGREGGDGAAAASGPAEPAP